MLIPRNLSLAEHRKFVRQIQFWHSVLQDVADLLKSFSEIVINFADQESSKGQALTRLWLMIDSSFRAITVLNLSGHFADSFSILRILFESHLHLWNILKGDENLARRFLNLSVIQDWRLHQEITKHKGVPELSGYFNSSFEQLEEKYKQALVTFGAKQGKILRNYTTISNEQLARLIDECESGAEPSKSFMFIMLYASTSEFLHGTYLRFVKGYVSLQRKKNHKIRNVLIPSPARGIETAWWACLITLDSIDWTQRIIQNKQTVHVSDLRNRIANLANYWKDRELE